MGLGWRRGSAPDLRREGSVDWCLALQRHLIHLACRRHLSLNFCFTVGGWRVHPFWHERPRMAFYVLQRTECFRREKTQITRTHCWLSFLIRNSHGGDQKILVSEGRSQLLAAVFVWMQGTCSSGSSAKSDCSESGSPVCQCDGYICDESQMLCTMGL